MIQGREHCLKDNKDSNFYFYYGNTFLSHRNVADNMLKGKKRKIDKGVLISVDAGEKVRSCVVHACAWDIVYCRDVTNDKKCHPKENIQTCALNM